MRLLLPLLLLPAVALGQQQTPVLTLSFEGEQTTTRAFRSCDGSFAVLVQAATTAPFCNDEVLVWVTRQKSCGNKPADAELSTTVTRSAALAGNARVTFALEDIPELTTAPDGGTSPCAEAATEVELQVCASFLNASGTTFGGCSENSYTKAQPLTVRLDTVPPEAPELEVTPGDSSFRVGVTPAEEEDVVYVEARPIGRVSPGGDGGTEVDGGTGADGGTSGWTDWRVVAGPLGADLRTAEVTRDVENDVTYEVRAHSVDLAGNEGPHSESKTVTPVFVCGFFCEYVKDGGTERGCAAGAGLLAPLGLLAAVAFLRRRR